MSLQLHGDLSYCNVDGLLVFLDTGKDRYFRLSETMELRFKAHQRGESTDHDLKKLIDSGLLTEAQSFIAPQPQPTMDRPARSAIELVQTQRPTTALDLLDTIMIVTRAQVQLKTQRLAHVLSMLDAYRRCKVLQARGPQGKIPEHRFADVATTFLRARPYVPIETCCLLDSISLIRFLAKRGLAANLVFAVTGAPFSAHCWVQVGTLVLNDTVGNTHAHTPIRVV